MADIASQQRDIESQKTLLASLKKDDADQQAIEDAKKHLGELQRALALAKGKSSGAEGKKRERLLLKTAKVCSTL